MEGRVYSVDSWTDTALERLLEVSGLRNRLHDFEKILIKPNLVEALQPPVTTPVELVEELVRYIKSINSDLHIIVGEGTGAIHYDTFHCFDTLGYTEMAARCGVELLDLNQEQSVRKVNGQCKRWPEMYLPAILDDCFLLSVPVLKAHSLSKVTLTMKNMMGCPPPSHYREGNSWGKSSFHNGIQEAVFDLNRYRTPDFTLLDATIGMARAHLWGPQCDPPVGRLAAGIDPVAIDSYGASLLEKDWKTIGHIKMAHGILGCADPIELIEL